MFYRGQFVVRNLVHKVLARTNHPNVQVMGKPVVDKRDDGSVALYFHTPDILLTPIKITGDEDFDPERDWQTYPEDEVYEAFREMGLIPDDDDDD